MHPRTRKQYLSAPALLLRGNSSRRFNSPRDTIERDEHSAEFLLYVSSKRKVIREKIFTSPLSTRLRAHPFFYGLPYLFFFFFLFFLFFLFFIFLSALTSHTHKEVTVISHLCTLTLSYYFRFHLIFLSIKSSQVESEYGNFMPGNFVKR